MNPTLPVLLFAALLAPVPASAADSWSQPQAPVHLYGSTYYVGSAGLSSVLIHGDAGSILLDGTLDTNVALIKANIEALGFDIHDVKLILNSHAHSDHAGGIAGLQRDSGATVVASPNGARALMAGHALADDPQAGYAAHSGWPPVAHVREVQDGETLRVGDLAVTAYFTPGHTSGSTTWTWQSCENDRCLHFVYADSLNPVAAPGFHYLADKSHPDLSARMRASIRTVASLPCDILIPVHPDTIGIDRKLASFKPGAATNPFVDAQACQDYAAHADRLLDARIAEENAAAKPKR